MNATNSAPDNPVTSDSYPMQAQFGFGLIFIFVLLAVVVGIVTLRTFPFDMETNPDYILSDCGGAAMLVELVVLFFLAALFASLNTRLTLKIARLEKMVTRLLLAQNSSAHCKKCGANIFASAKFCPECGEKQA